MILAQRMNLRDIEDIRDIQKMKHELIKRAKMEQKIRYERIQVPKRIAVSR